MLFISKILEHQRTQTASLNALLDLPQYSAETEFTQRRRNELRSFIARSGNIESLEFDLQHLDGMKKAISLFTLELLVYKMLAFNNYFN